MTITALSHSVKSATSRIGRRQGLHLTAGDRDIAVPGTDSPRDAASPGLAATGGRVAQTAKSAFQRFRRPFSPCQEAMALLAQFGPFPNYCLVSVCWMLIWKAKNFDWKRSSPMGDSKIDSTTCATSPTKNTSGSSGTRNGEYAGLVSCRGACRQSLDCRVRCGPPDFVSTLCAAWSHPGHATTPHSRINSTSRRPVGVRKPVPVRHINR